MENLLKASFIPLNGDVLNFTRGTCDVSLVFEQKNVSEDFYNLLCAAPLLYQTLFYQKQSMEALIALCKEVGAYEAIPRFEEMQGACELVLRISETGILEFIKKKS